ncbi:MAG: helix-turn-helix transcriptional regulator [Rhodobacteraceae bacterium]|nr:helix-turn-helix transcriptional regulator [Paracoccaceae bacterium]
MMPLNTPVDVLADHAAEAAAVLKLLANEQRLLLLCCLSQGEASVGQLVNACALSQASASQHLAKLRTGGLLKTRRDGTTIFYRLADDSVRQLIDMLCERFGDTHKRPQ